MLTNYTITERMHTRTARKRMLSALF